MRVACLGTGSRGNSMLVECGETRFLVDAGFSGAQLARRLEILGVEPDSVSLAVVTHEHRDHAAGIGVAARRWGWPLVMTGPTHAACDGLLRGGEEVRALRGETRFRVGPAEVHAFGTCHDAADPVACTVTEVETGLRVGIATDLGRATAPVRAALAGCHFLILEANHDERLLRESHYPWSVKQRIGGSRGHLSNRLAAELAAELLHPGLGGILLAHLSDACNAPGLARDAVERRLHAERAWRGRIAVAVQDEPSEWFPVLPPAGAQLRLQLTSTT